MITLDLKTAFKGFINPEKICITVVGAEEDNDAIEALITQLREAGFKCWSIPTDMLPGQDRELEVWKAVYDAQIVLVCLSSQFKSEGKHQKLLNLAIETRDEIPEGLIKVIPLIIEADVKTPAKLAKEHLTPTNILVANGIQKLREAIYLSRQQRPKPEQNYDVKWK